MSVSITNTDATLTGKTLAILERDQTITGAWTFNRGASAPFIVPSGAAVVSNLDADKLDGVEGLAFLLKAGGTMTGNLLFTDATYDIGASGATRPRDLFLSRNAVIGGTLGVTGAATLSSTLAVTGAITATAGQIIFPAAQNAAAGANTLDDYEEGTWTPVLGGSGGTSGQTYGVQEGRYIKIGKLVYASARITFTAKGTITGNAQFQGLPFTTATTAGPAGGGVQVHYFGALNTNWTFLTGHINSAATTAQLYGVSAAATSSSNLVTGDLTNTSDFMFTVIYEAAA